MALQLGTRGAKTHPSLHSASNSKQRCIGAPRRASPASTVCRAVAEVAGGLGVLGAGVFGALWNLEKQNGTKLQQEVQQLQQQLQEARQQQADAQKQLEVEQRARKEAEEWKPRLDSAQEELFKLEKALELKDGQLAVFMNTARRQIKGLEDHVKELQKM